MSINYVNLVCDITDGSGNPVETGTITFIPNSVLTDTTDHITITQLPVVVSLLGNPSPAVQLAATDNSSLSPSGWSWLIAYYFPGAPARKLFLLPYSAGATQYLSDIATVTLAGYLPESGGTMAGALTLAGTPALAIPSGAAAGFALTSDSNGNASWQPPYGLPTAYVAAPLPSGTDDYAAVSGPWSAAMASGVPFRFGPGKYKFSQPLPAITTNGWVVEGAGKNGASADEGTLLQVITGASPATFPAGIINLTGKTCRVADLSLDGNGISFSELSMTHSEATVRHTIFNVSMRNNSVGPGLWNIGCEDVLFLKSEIAGSEAVASTQKVGAFISCPGGTCTASGCDWFAPFFIQATDYAHFGSNAGTVVIVNPSGTQSNHVTVSTAWIYDGAGISGGQLFSPVDCALAAADGAVTASATTFTSASSNFSAGISAQPIVIYGAGAGGVPLVTTATYASATTLTLAAAASTTVTGAFWWMQGGYLCNVTIRGGRMISQGTTNWIHGTLPSFATVTLDDKVTLANTKTGSPTDLFIFSLTTFTGSTSSFPKCMIGPGGVQVNTSGTPKIHISTGGSSTTTVEVAGEVGGFPSTLIGQSNQATAPSVPASTVPLPSPFPSQMYVTISGGTVSAISVNGVAQASVAGTFLIRPGAAITLTYSAAPTWAWSQVPSDAFALNAAALSNPLTTSGDTLYGGSSGAVTRLAGITAATKNFLTQTGTGSASAAPAWGTLASADLPVIPGQYLCAPSVYAPATPANLLTSSATLAAVSSANVNTGSFTAPPSGSVVVTASFVMSAPANIIWAFALAAHGTVTPVVGNVVLGEWSSSVSNPNLTIPFVVTGLTAGTSYNLDLLFALASGSNLAVRANGQTSTTPTGATNAPNGPVIMMVQAV